MTMLLSSCLCFVPRRNLLAYALKYMKTTEIGEIVVDAFPDRAAQSTVDRHSPAP